MKAPKIVAEFSFSHPLENLRPTYNSGEPEALFTAAFARSYSDKALKIHSRSGKTNILLASELPVNGYGIADLISVTWKCASGISGQEISLHGVRDEIVTIRVFEAKLRNWKKGLMQAHRYSYFADASILVYPVERISRVLDQLDTFHKLGIGLWGFDESTGSIRTIYTPRPRRPRVPKHRQCALQRILSSAISLPVV